MERSLIDTDMLSEVGGLGSIQLCQCAACSIGVSAFPGRLFSRRAGNRRQQPEVDVHWLVGLGSASPVMWPSSAPIAVSCGGAGRLAPRSAAVKRAANKPTAELST